MCDQHLRHTTYVQAEACQGVSSDGFQDGKAKKGSAKKKKGSIIWGGGRSERQ